MSSQTTKNNFHNTIINSAEKEYMQIDKYVTWKRSRRTVDYSFFAHFHPYTDELIEKLNRDGLESLLDVNYLQTLQYDLATLYHPAGAYVTKFPKKEIDVSDDGPYSIYNWELF